MARRAAGAGMTTAAPPERELPAGVEDVGGKQYMRDAKNRLTPIELVSAKPIASSTTSCVGGTCAPPSCRR